MRNLLCEVSDMSNALKVTVTLAAALLAFLAPGCTQTKVTAPTWGLSRITFLQQVQVPQLTIGTNGTAELKGYANDGGQQVTLAIIQELLRARLPAVAP